MTRTGEARTSAGEARTSAGEARAGAREGAEAAFPWRGAGPELAAAVALGVLRILLPRAAPDQARLARKRPGARPLSGYARRRYAVETAISSLVFYNEELRPVLEHLLAARLAQRHGVHLYQNPAAARALLCRDPRDADLWFWLDPATRPPESWRDRKEQSGIPGPTLARLLDRLELL